MSSDPLGGPLLLLALLIAGFVWTHGTISALKALNENKIRHEAEENEAAERLSELAEHRESLLTSLRALRLLTAASAAVWTGYMVLHQVTALLQVTGTALKAVCLAAACLLLTLLMAVPAGTAARLAERRPERYVLFRSRAIRAAGAIFRPLGALIDGMARGLQRLFGARPGDEPDEVTEEDIRQMVDIGEESGNIEENEKELIENIFAFNNRNAEDVMTHRTDVSAIWIGDDDDTIIQTILSTGRSRFPVYDEDVDDIIGILNTRDWLLNRHIPHPRTLRQLLREAYFVPETVQADVLFRDMQKRKVQMAVVVDEYGGMSGIVTIEDLLEEIVGNIYDEFDPQAEEEIVLLERNKWRMPGAATLEDVENATGVKLPTDEDYDTLGGLIFSQYTTIPEDGTKPELEVCGLRIQVEKIEDHRVVSALVSVSEPEENTAKDMDEPAKDTPESEELAENRNKEKGSSAE